MSTQSSENRTKVCRWMGYAVGDLRTSLGPGGVWVRVLVRCYTERNTDKACEILSQLIRIILHVKKDSVNMGKHTESTLDGPHNLWSIFLNIYAQRGNSYTCDYFQHALVSCWP